MPDELKATVPQTRWGRILSATPIVMTVVATALAGLASSEMTRAQYRRSLAAQQQSKAGDQWSLFQAKRVRGSMQRTTLDILGATSDVHPLDAAAFAKSDADLRPAAGPQTLAALQRGELPAIPTGPTTGPPTPKVAAALEALENAKAEPEIAALLAQTTDQMLEDALDAAQHRAQALDVTLKPVNRAIDELEARLVRQSATEGTRSGPATSLRRDVTAARLRYTAMRYDAEARLNQAIANVYELQVRKSNIEAERLHKRSQRFFYGMLAAQAAVIVATFSIAARERNALWWLAAAAGLAAIAYATYVYLAV